MSTTSGLLPITTSHHAGTCASVVLTAGALTVVVLLMVRLLSVGSWFAWQVLGMFAIAAATVMALALRNLRTGPFGPANRVTLVRLALVALLAGFITEGPLDPAQAWAVVSLAVIALVLDGVDGFLARRHQDATAFGARFDVETDALTMLVLAMLVWRVGAAGAWILTTGLMRYVFIASAAVWPWLNRPLPPSRRRQAAFVATTLMLITCLVPVLPSDTAVVTAAIGLTLLAASFAIDVVWLIHKRLASDVSAR